MTNRSETTAARMAQYLVDKLRFNENTILLLIASILGIVGGFGAVGFRSLIELLQTIVLGDYRNILEIVSALPWQKRLFIPSMGGLVIGPLIYYWGRETKGHGVPEVMDAVALKGGKIRTRVMFLKTFVSAVTISTGGSVGREGPIVQIGSSLGSAIGQLMKVGQARLKILVACGAAAGIAATFNAPIAGVLFSIEIILGNYAITTLVPLILSSVMATIVGRWWFGDVPAFEIPVYRLQSAWEIGPYILLGIASGVLAVAFVKLLYSLEDAADAIPVKGWFMTPFLLFLAGVMVVFFPHVYGVGYDTISQVLKGQTAWQIMLMLIPVKMLATSITLAAGGSGGIFAPSLFIGAVFGGFFGFLTQYFFPDIVASPGAYAVVGMSAMVAGTTHAPLTAFMVIFEMTGDYKLILPLMLCSILASFIASVIKKESIYTMKLARRGVDLSKGMEVSIMQSTRVKDVTSQNMVVLHERTGFDELLKKVINTNEAYYFVVDDTGKYQGSFNVHDIKSVLNEKSLSKLVVAKDLASFSTSPSIETDATLADCMRQFAIHEVDELPVVDSKASDKLIGKVGRHDIINFYNSAILRQGSLGLNFIQAKLPQESPALGRVDLPDGVEISVFPVTASLQGRTLQDLDIRRDYGATVIAINQLDKWGERAVTIPDPEKTLKKDDMIVVIGTDDAIKQLKTAFRLKS